MGYECHVVVDLEFNPVYGENRAWLKNEIIEIGAVKLNEYYEEIGRFSCFVKPELSDHIAPKIQKLTGIRDNDVMNAQPFEEAISVFRQWVGTAKCRMYSWSSSDLQQLDEECRVKGVDFPVNMTRWMDLQMVWQRIVGFSARQQISLSSAAGYTGVSFDPQQAHRAMYDTEVTVDILKTLKNRDYLESVREARSRITPIIEHSTFTLGDTMGDKLGALMTRLQAAG